MGLLTYPIPPVPNGAAHLFILLTYCATLPKVLFSPTFHTELVFVKICLKQQCYLQIKSSLLQYPLHLLLTAKSTLTWWGSLVRVQSRLPISSIKSSTFLRCFFSSSKYCKLDQPDYFEVSELCKIFTRLNSNLIIS